MAWYPDLSQCDYFGDHPCLTAVGWLGRDHDFPVGAVDKEIYSKLRELLQTAWQFCLFAGLHDCEFCLYEPPMGGANLFVPGDGRIYVCPKLILHYMNAHHYHPPHEFCQAVLACPEMLSKTYFEALLASGGRDLIRMGEKTT